MLKSKSFSPRFLGIAFSTLLLPVALNAVTISFEEPDYTEGDVNFVDGGGGPASFLPDNQDGWSNSTSTMQAAIAPNSANGLSGSGQFMTIPTPPSSPGNAYTMIAGKQTPPTATGVTSISFDIRFVTHTDTENVGGGTQNMAGFAQTFPNGDEFNNSNAGIMFGQTGPTSFGFRVAGFGGTGARLAPSFEGDQQIPDPVVGNWYGVSATIAPEAEGNREVTLSLYDYDSGTFWANYAFDVQLSHFGSVAPEDSEGVFVRLTRNLTNDDLAGAIDNLEATVVPEPSTYALMFGLLGLGLAVVRRLRKA